MCIRDRGKPLEASKGAKLLKELEFRSKHYETCTVQGQPIQCVVTCSCDINLRIAHYLVQ